MAQNADIVQLHAPFPLADLAVWLFGCKGKLVVWWHSDIVRQKTAAKVLAPILHNTLKRADAIIVAAKENLTSSAFLPRYADKCTVIPYGLDLAAYENFGETDFLTKRLHRPSAKKLLFVGRLVYYKGIDVLLEAMKGVECAELFVVGSGPMERLPSNNVHFLGALPRESLLSAFHDCDLLVFPSCANSEAFGITQLEAMYYGKPVINTQLPTAVPWVSVHGETGLTVPVGDSDALQGAILQLTRDDDLRHYYGKNAANRVRSVFDGRHMLDKLYTHYKKILGIYS